MEWLKKRWKNKITRAVIIVDSIVILIAIAGWFWVKDSEKYDITYEITQRIVTVNDPSTSFQKSKVSIGLEGGKTLKLPVGSQVQVGDLYWFKLQDVIYPWEKIIVVRNYKYVGE